MPSNLASRSRYRGSLAVTATALAVLLLVAAALPAQQPDPQPAPPAEDPETEPEEKPPPKISEMPLPTAAELLQGKPFAWVILQGTNKLTDNSCIVVESLPFRPYTRQLMELGQKNTKSVRRAALRNAQKWPEFLRLTLKQADEEPEFALPRVWMKAVLHHEDLMLLRTDRLLEAGKLRQAFEVLLVMDRRFRPPAVPEIAWRLPRWPGFDDRRNRLLLLEVDRRLKEQAPGRAMVFLEQLHAEFLARRVRNVLLDEVPDDYQALEETKPVWTEDWYPESLKPGFDYLAFRETFVQRFSDLVVRCLDSQITAAVKAGDYRQARFFLLTRIGEMLVENRTRLIDQLSDDNTVAAELQALFPDDTELSLRRRGARKFHALAWQLKTEMVFRQTWNEFDRKWRSRFEKEQQDLLGRAAKESDPARAVDLAEEAARRWPFEVRGTAAMSLQAEFKRTFNQHQRLRVGVVELAGKPSACHYDTEPDRRHHELVTETLFTVGRFDQTPFYDTRYFEKWEPTDLGRQVDFLLRPRRMPWQAGPAVRAAPIISMLTSRIDPDSDHYDERLASYLDGLAYRSPTEFSLRFSRVPVRFEALFRVPVTVSNGNGSPPSLLSRRYGQHARDERHVAYRRTESELDRRPRSATELEPDLHVAEVIELRYDTFDKAIQGLLRGEVLMLPRVPDWLVPLFLDNEQLKIDFQVVPYGLPTTHVVQFNPASRAMKSPELRRAVGCALDRHKVLIETVLRHERSGEPRGRVVSSPFPSRSYGVNPQVRLRPYNRILAMALASVAANRLGGSVPQLKMLCPDDPVVRAAAEQLVAQWARAGIPVSIVENPPATGQAVTDWDLAYRTIRMTEPIVDLWSFLTLQDRARVVDLVYLPDWLRQEIIELDRALDFPSAIDRLKQIHQHLQNHVHLVPLWEVDEVMIVRRRVRGIPSKPLSTYQGVEQWAIVPWYPKD